MTNSEIPPGWSLKTMADVLRPLSNGRLIQQGWSPQCHKEASPDANTWGVLKTTSVQPGRFLSEHNKRLPEDLSPDPSLEVVQGDVLLTCAGPRSRCAVPCLVRSTRPRLMISGKIYRFRANEDLVDSRFLELFLLGPRSQSSLEAMKTGISDSGLNLTQSRFLRMPVSIPPIEEQRQIVDILEDHLSRIDAAQLQLTASVRKAEAWRRSVVDQRIWAGRVPLRPVNELLREPMRNGHSARSVRDGEAGVRTLTLTAVTRTNFTDTFTKMTAADPTRVGKLWLMPGDILVQRSNAPELVGTTAMYSGPRDWAIFPDLMIRLRADSAVALPEYLTAALRSERAHRHLRGKAKGLSGSMPKIDQEAIASTVVPVPTLERQQKLIGLLAEDDQACRRLTNTLETVQRQGVALRRALLEAAFSGRLTGAATELDQIKEMAGV